MKPVVVRLEAEAVKNLQIIRLNIDMKNLTREHNVVFTPTFIHFVPDGNKLRDNILVLARGHVLYEL